MSPTSNQLPHPFRGDHGIGSLRLVITKFSLDLISVSDYVFKARITFFFLVLPPKLRNSDFLGEYKHQFNQIYVMK